MTMTEPVNFARWIEGNKHLLKPPVGNKTLAVGDDFVVMIVGGPNARTDFHVDRTKMVLQLKGNMHVNVVIDGSRVRVDIARARPGCCRATCRTPRSARRKVRRLVIERVREEGTLEKFQWYCPDCAALVHEVELQVVTS